MEGRVTPNKEIPPSPFVSPSYFSRLPDNELISQCLENIRPAWDEFFKRNIPFIKKNIKKRLFEYGVDPDVDADLDGMSNYEEFMAGTDPNNAFSVFRLEDVTTEDPAGVLIEWQAVIGKSYRVEYTSDLFSPWIVPDMWRGIVATSDVMMLLDDGSETGGVAEWRYYRVKLDE